MQKCQKYRADYEQLHVNSDVPKMKKTLLKKYGFLISQKKNSNLNLNTMFLTSKKLFMNNKCCHQLLRHFATEG